MVGTAGRKGRAKGFWEMGGMQSGGWSGAQGSAGGVWNGGKGGGLVFGGKGTYWFDEAQGPPMLAWSGSETTQKKASNQGWNVLGSLPLWGVRASVKTRSCEAQEAPLRNRFEHLSEDDGE